MTVVIWDDVEHMGVKEILVVVGTKDIVVIPPVKVKLLVMAGVNCWMERLVET